VSWRKAGKAAGGALLDRVREWIAIIGGLGAGLLIRQGGGGSVPGIGCLVLAAGALVAAFFGMRDRDVGGRAGALTLGIATVVAFGLATGT
jgi:hypothetical protein